MVLVYVCVCVIAINALSPQKKQQKKTHLHLNWAVENAISFRSCNLSTGLLSVFSWPVEGIKLHYNIKDTDLASW